MEPILILSGLLTVLAACGVIFSRSSLNSALWLIAVLLTIAGHFAFMGAGFLASLQLLIYAGAIMVLMLFVIMLLGIEEKTKNHLSRIPIYSALIIGTLYIIALHKISPPEVLSLLSEPKPLSYPEASAEVLGERIFRHFVYPLQIIGLILLSAIIGAVLLAQEKRRPLAPGRGLQAVRARQEEQL